MLGTIVQGYLECILAFFSIRAHAPTEEKISSKDSKELHKLLDV